MSKKFIIPLVIEVALAVIVGVILIIHFHRQTSSQALSVDELERMTEEATTALRENKFDSALELFGPVIDSYYPAMPEAGLRACARAFNNAGYIQFFYYGNYALAYTYFLNSQDIAEKLNFTGLLPHISLNIGNIYGLYDLRPQAQELYTQAFFQALEQEEWEIVVTAFINLASGHLSILDLTGMEEVTEAFKNVNIPDTIPNVRYAKALYKAVMAYKSNDLAATTHYLEEADLIRPNGLGKEHTSLTTPILIGTIKLKEGKLTEARDLLLSALKATEENGEYALSVECWQRLGEYYSKSNHLDSARICSLRQFEIRDSLFNITEFNTVNEVATLHAQRQMNANLETITEKKKLMEQVLIVVLVFTLVIVILLIWISKKNRTLHERNVELYHKYLEQTTLKTSVTPEVQIIPNNTISNQKAFEMEAEQMEALYTKILEVMESEVIYSPSFSADTLANLTQSKTRYISHVIAEKTGKNFSTLLSEYRVKEASRKLSDSAHYGNLTLEAISESVGFKSRTYFTTTFKKITGLTPREFQRIATSDTEKMG